MTVPRPETPFRRPRPARPLAIAAGFALVVALGACASDPMPAFDLTTPRGHVRGAKPISGQLVVGEPTALNPLEEQRIIVRDAKGSVSYLGGAQWADRLPRLFQARLIQTFENASKSRAVARPGDGLAADYQLNTELRAFQLDAARGEAVVEVSAKLLAVKSGKIVAARVFSSRVRVASSGAPEVAQALDRALATVLVEMVRWTGNAI